MIIWNNISLEKSVGPSVLNYLSNSTQKICIKLVIQLEINNKQSFYIWFRGHHLILEFPGKLGGTPLSVLLISTPGSTRILGTF